MHHLLDNNKAETMVVATSFQSLIYTLIDK